MANFISLIIGIVALICAAVAFIPLAVIGAGIGATSNSHAGRNLNLFVIVVGIVRLMIGGGIF